MENEFDRYPKSGKGKKKGETKTQLSSAENNKLVTVKMEVDLIFLKLKSKEWPSPFTPIADLAHAYSVTSRTVRDCANKHLRNKCSSSRKKRSDADRTIFNSREMREKLYTPYNYFKKAQRKHHPADRLTDEELMEAYNKLDPAVLHECQLGAEPEKQLAANIISEIKQALQKTNGSISWERLAAYITGGEDKVQPVSEKTLSKKPLFCYTNITTMLVGW